MVQRRVITDADKETIANFGALGYVDVSEMNLILNWPDEDIAAEIQDEDSEFNRLLAKGKAQSDYKINAKLLEMAHGGDYKAIEILKKIKR